MKHLSGLDATFLHMETPEMPMHVGGMNLFDLPEGYQGNFYDDVKQHITKRMHLASIFTKKLALMPFDLANPVWVEDGSIDLDYHIRQITLPKPGTLAQLEAYVGRLHSSLLDRSRPLWEMYVFSGLETGQAAFYSKVHHAALDGQGAAVMAQALLDLGPTPRSVPPPPPKEENPYQPEMRTLFNAALSNTAQQCLTIVKALPEAAKVAARLLTPKIGGQASGQQKHKVGFGPRTPLNVSVTNQRSFATLSVPVDETKEIAKVFGGTLNDVVLAVCSGALRDFLASKGALPGRSLVAALPVSLREEGNTNMGNQVSMMQTELATHIADPILRLRKIIGASSAMKTTLKRVKSVLPTDFPSLGVPWLMSGVVALYGRSRLADSIPPIVNLVISNVPGPRMPLFLAGARMSTNFPVSIVAHGVALNITVQSYNGSLDFGLIACRRAVPDVAVLGQLMQQAHQQLLTLARATASEGGAEAVASEAASEVTSEVPVAKKTTRRKTVGASAANGAAPVDASVASTEVKASKVRKVRNVAKVGDVAASTESAAANDTQANAATAAPAKKRAKAAGKVAVSG